jgi:hypothetical protein
VILIARLPASFAWFVALGAAALLASIGACTGGDSSSSSSGSSGAGSCPNDLPAACPSPPPSYAQDVAPVFQQSCTPCHAAGGVQEGRLLTDYAHAFALRGDVLNQVHACRMPPSNGPPLTAAGRKVLLAWLVCGAPDN